MSRRYWPVIAAIGYLALATGSLSQEIDSASADTDKAAEQAQVAAAVAPAQKAAADSPQSYRPECENAEDREDAAFCEARKSRIAAEQSNILARQAYQLSFWGTVGLVVSLLFTAWAASAAGRAAVAAEKAVELGDAVSRKELRAYITIKCPNVTGVDDPTKKPTFHLVIDNVGATPARHVAVTAACAVGPNESIIPQTPDAVDDPESIGSRGIIGNGHPKDLTQQVDFDWGQDDIDRLRQGWALYVYGRIDYLDVFDERYSTNFRFGWRPATDAALIFVCGQGNEST